METTGGSPVSAMKSIEFLTSFDSSSPGHRLRRTVLDHFRRLRSPHRAASRSELRGRNPAVTVPRNHSRYARVVTKPPGYSYCTSTVLKEFCFSGSSRLLSTISLGVGGFIRGFSYHMPITNILSPLPSSFNTSSLRVCSLRHIHRSIPRTWRTKFLLSYDEERKIMTRPDIPDYSRWSHDDLIQRITYLERQIKKSTVFTSPLRSAIFS